VNNDYVTIEESKKFINIILPYFHYYLGAVELLLNGQKEAFGFYLYEEKY